jgi:ribosomal-protein-alanine N-acetyltransferase
LTPAANAASRALRAVSTGSSSSSSGPSSQPPKPTDEIETPVSPTGRVSTALLYDDVYPRDRIATPRLVLEPISAKQGQAILAGDISAIQAGEGWPLAETIQPFETAAKHGVVLPAWFVTLGDVVIGDIHTHGDVDDAGDIEIGYGLAEPYRGRGYGTELVKGISQWLLRRTDVERVVARHVPVENTPSRRALESAGFVLEQEDEQYTWYALEA